MDISIPIAKAIGTKSACAEEPCLLDTLKHSYNELCETIKLHRENYGDFCEDEEELERSLGPIEHDPEPYSNGTIKTRPILKKYAKAMCEKLELESRIETTEEMMRDVDLTPQQVKLDMKRYVSLSEKKIASQQKQIDELNEKMSQMIQAITLIASPWKGSVLSTAMMLNLTSIEEMLLENNINGFNEWDILHTTSIKSIEKLHSYGVDINYSSPGSIGMPGMPGGKIMLRGIQLDETQKYYLQVKSNRGTLVLNLGPYRPSEMQKFYQLIVCISPAVLSPTEQAYPYELTSLKIATLKGSIELTKFLVEKGAKIGDTQYHTPNGPEGDLVAGYLQTHGSKTVIRF